jgi:hypothetical protein
VSRRMTSASRIRRAAAGLILTILAASGTGAPWTWIGLLPLTAGAIGWCPFEKLSNRLNGCWTR